MNKRAIILGCILAAGIGLNTGMPAFAGFQEHYTLAQQYFFNSRYSSAIDEFKKALMINFMDNSATRWNLHPCDLPFPWDENLYLYGSARPYRQQIQEAKRKVQMQKRKTQ